MPRDPWKISLESFLSGDELDRLLDFLECRVAECSGAPQTTAATDELIIHGLVFSGLRNSEFCTLKLQDTIVGTRRSEFRVVGTPREDRTVCVPRALSERILRYVRDIRRELLHAETDPRDLAQPLIVNERGRGYERTSLYRRVVRILTAAGLGERASVQHLWLPGVRPHRGQSAVRSAPDGPRTPDGHQHLCRICSRRLRRPGRHARPATHPGERGTSVPRYQPQEQQDSHHTPTAAQLTGQLTPGRSPNFH
jgi:integrase/recombinase XerD